MMAMRLVSKWRYIGFTVCGFTRLSRKSIHTFQIGIIQSVAHLLFFYDSISYDDAKEYQYREYGIDRTFLEIFRCLIEVHQYCYIPKYRNPYIHCRVENPTPDTTEPFTREQCTRDNNSIYPKDSEKECKEEEGSVGLFHEIVLIIYFLTGLKLYDML
jgi:hypothetical protein